MYQAYTWLSIAGSLLLLTGSAGIARFIYFYSIGLGDGKVQSLILSSTLISLGFTLFVLGLIADLVSINRKLLEEIRDDRR